MTDRSLVRFLALETEASNPVFPGSANQLHASRVDADAELTHMPKQD